MLLPFILGLLVLGQFDLGVDEAHYMLYARYLDWSYYDHPPLVGWVHFLFSLFWDESLFSARLPALLIGLFSTYQVYLFLRELRFSQSNSILSAIGFALTLQFFVLHLFLLPETLLFISFWFVMASLKQVVLKKGQGYSWIFFGFSLGLAALSKYTAIFFLVPIAICIFQEFRFSFLKHRNFYFAVLVALFMITPILFWNVHHDWLSFRYQLNHVAGGGDGLRGFLKSFALQFVIYGPLLWGFSIFGLFELSRRTDIQSRFSFWTAIVFAGFFIWSSFREVVLPHWPALFYLVTIPVGLASALEFTRYKRATQLLVLLNSILPVVLCGFFLTGFAWSLFSAGLKEVAGWPEVMREAELHLKEDEQLAFSNWTYGSRALFYGKDLAAKTVIFDDRFDQFDLWEPRSKKSKILLVQFSFDHDEIPNGLDCNMNQSEKEQTAIFRAGVHLYDVRFHRCTRLTESK